MLMNPALYVFLRSRLSKTDLEEALRIHALEERLPLKTPLEQLNMRRRIKTALGESGITTLQELGDFAQDEPATLSLAQALVRTRSPGVWDFGPEGLRELEDALARNGWSLAELDCRHHQD